MMLARGAAGGQMVKAQQGDTLDPVARELRSSSCWDTQLTSEQGTFRVALPEPAPL